MEINRCTVYQNFETSHYWPFHISKIIEFGIIFVYPCQMSTNLKNRIPLIIGIGFLHYQSSNNVNKWILVTIYHSTTLNALLVITLTGISWSYFYLGKECSYVPTSRMLHRLFKPMTRSFGKCTLQGHFNREQRIVEENLSIWSYSSFSMKDDGKIVTIHFY